MTTYIPSITLPPFVFSQPAISILLPVVLGPGIAALSFTREATEKTYRSLKQPPLRPPPQVFGPVWTVLYCLMGYAAHRAWITGLASENPKTVALTKHSATLYTIQLFLNLIFQPLFFRLRRPVEATVDIVTLTGVTGYLTYLFFQLDQTAGWCFVPYVGWLSFATYLCAGFGYLNKWKVNAPTGEIMGDKKAA